jgi:hypothetical protein
MMIVLDPADGGGYIAVKDFLYQNAVIDNSFGKLVHELVLWGDSWPDECIHSNGHTPDAPQSDERPPWE